ncbi:MAG TPA: HAD-IIIA family hydrolase, partial [Firmicutes bacterium]|nr:HAD-IIIA family hydrolase [Candidatus Fermentithermobacillaceae bacterium]
MSGETPPKANTDHRFPRFVQAVFIDRDGTMGGTGEFIHPREFSLYPFTREALNILKDEGFLVFAITNQYRISRGEATEEDFRREFEALGLDGAYICPHDTGVQCDCKKPAPGMLLRAAREHGLDLTRCVVIGDTGATDMLAAHAVGAIKVLVQTGWGESSLGEYRGLWAHVEPDYVAADLLDAARWVVGLSRFRGIWLGFIDTLK